MSVDALAEALAGIETQQEPYERCLGVDDLRGDGKGLWFLCTQILGYDLLTNEFHRPMLREWDLIDRRRWRAEQVDTLDLWPRDHYKTWCLRARAIRRFMRDPRCTQMWWHAVEEMAEESVVATGKSMQHGKEFRRICTKSQLALPSVQARKFVTASGFRLPANDLRDAPSMRSAGAGTEVTGGHSKFGMLDDCIGLNDVLNNQMASKKQWYRGTVRNVVRSDGSLDVIGTRWSEDDIYSDWVRSKYWVTTVRACLEADGKPDYNGTPVLLTMEQIQRKRDEMGELMFALQMMNDATPKSDLPWRAERESLLVPWSSKTEICADGPGLVFVLSDPAPAVIGSPRGTGEKKRGDGSKDEWATATVKFKNLGGMQVAFLLELTASRDWTIDEGLDEVCRQMQRWSTNKCFIEFASVDWTPSMKSARARNGVAVYLDEKGRLPRYASNYASGAKNRRFGELASWAQVGRFFICEDTVDRGMLERFFEQVEHWRPLPNGENTLPHDDLGDVVARCMDTALSRWSAPQLVKDKPAWHPLMDDEPRDDAQPRSRYCGV